MRACDLPFWRQTASRIPSPGFGPPGAHQENRAPDCLTDQAARTEELGESELDFGIGEPGVEITEGRAWGNRRGLRSNPLKHHSSNPAPVRVATTPKDRELRLASPSTSSSQRAANPPVIPSNMSVNVPERCSAEKRFHRMPTTTPITIVLQVFTAGLTNRERVPEKRGSCSCPSRPDSRG